MTAALDLHPAPGHPAAVAAAVHDVLDHVEVAALAAGEYAAAVTEWDRAIRRMEAVKLQLVAGADRTGADEDAGCASTAGWLSKQTRSGTAAAARTTRLARDLDERLPATQAGLCQGEISAEHAAVIAHAGSRLPRGLSVERVATVEARLVDQARRVTPAQLRQLARRALEAVERDRVKVDAHQDDQLRDEEADALARTRLSLHDNADGSVSGHFTVPLLAGTVLKKVLDALTSPRRVWTGSTNGGSASTRDGSGSTNEGRDWGHERGLAFAQLLEHLPTDRLHSRTPPPSWSRSTWRPSAVRCELHHKDPWSRQGRTDLDQMVPLCGFHHRRIHDPGHLHARLPDGSLRFRRRT